MAEFHGNVENATRRSNKAWRTDAAMAHTTRSFVVGTPGLSELENMAFNVSFR